jgi:hypothetical protein
LHRVLSFCHLLLAIEAADANAPAMAGAYSRLSEVIAGYGGLTILMESFVSCPLELNETIGRLRDVCP